ncbi:MAG: hypothetical protein ACR2OZ_04505 [Verrucomicrobiales bacterium]
MPAHPGNPPRKSGWSAIVVSLGGVIFGGLFIWLLVSNARMRGELTQMREENAARRAKSVLATEETGPNKGEPKLAPGDSAAAVDAAAARAPAAPAAARAESKRRVNREEMAAMLKSPVMQKILASQTSALMQMTYDRLMNRLQLSPEERDYFQRLLVEKQSNVQNLGMQFLNADLPAEERQALVKKIEEAWTAGEAKIREFLNDETDFAYYQTYNHQEAERKEVGMFEASLPEADTLDAARSDNLANLQSEARKDFHFTVDFYDQRNFGNPTVLNSAAVQRFLDEQTEFQSQVAEKAAALLTPSQLAAFKQNQAAMRQMMNMQLTSIVQMANGQ